MLFIYVLLPPLSISAMNNADDLVTKLVIKTRSASMRKVLHHRPWSFVLRICTIQRPFSQRRHDLHDQTTSATVTRARNEQRAHITVSQTRVKSVCVTRGRATAPGATANKSVRQEGTECPNRREFFCHVRVISWERVGLA